MTWSQPIVHRWNWLDDGLLPLLLALLRFCWLWPWLGLIRYILSPSYTSPLLSPALLIGVPVLSLLLARWAASPDVQPETIKDVRAPQIAVTARLGIALLGLVVILTALWWQLYRSDYALWNGTWVKSLGLTLIHGPANELTPAIPITLVLIYLWLRGMLDAVKTLGHDDVWGTFISGIALLVLYLLVTTMSDLPIQPGSINLIVLFFGVGMAALAFSSIKITTGLDRALGLGQRRATRSPKLSRYWLFSVLTTVIVLLGLGVGLGFLLAPDQVAVLLGLITWVLGKLWDLIGLVILALGYIFVVIAYGLSFILQPLLRWLLGLFATKQQRQLLQPPSPPPALPSLTTTTATVPDVYRWIALGVFILVVIVIFALVLRRLRAAQNEEFDEERESILSADLLQDQLARLFQKLFGRLRSASAQNPFLSLADEHDTRRMIRNAYQNFLAAAVDLGQARSQSQTPREYQQQVAQELPEAASLLATLTEHYDYARYAIEPPTPEAAIAAQQAWTQTQQIIETKRRTAEEQKATDFEASKG